MPKYIFDNRILICDKAFYYKTKADNAGNPTRQNTDAYIFYDGFMDSVAPVDKMLVKKLIEALKEKFVNNNYPFRYDNEIKKYMDVFFNIKKSVSGDFTESMLSISNYSGIGSSKAEKQIAEYSLEQGCTSFKKLINHLCSHEQDLAAIMGIKAEKSATFDKKLYTAANITAKNYSYEGVMINPKTNLNDLRSIFFDYIYVKSVRNQINHASDEDNLNEEQKNVLEKRGYNVREFNTKVICKTIRSSVERIEKAAAAIQTI